MVLTRPFGQANIALSGSASGGSPRSFDDRAQDAVSFLEWNPPRDGASDCGPLLSQAAAETAAAGKTLVVPNRGFAYRLSTPWTIPNGAEILFSGSPRLLVSIENGITLSGNDASLNGRFRVVGGHNGSSYLVLISGSGNYLESVRLSPANSGIDIKGHENVLSQVEAFELRGTAIRLDGATRNRIGSVRVRNGAGFGVWLINGASRNEISSAVKYSDPARFTAWQTANRPEQANGRMGLETIGCTFGCNENLFSYVIAERSGDAGISLSGDRNVVSGGQSLDCELNGVSLIGSGNIVSNYVSRGCLNGFSFTPNAGGIAKANTLVAPKAIDNRQYGIQNNDASNYRLWVAGASFGTGSAYCRYGSNLYRTATGANVSAFGTTPPTHTTGTVSDGVVNWTWINGDSVTLDADRNMVIAGYAKGNTTADWNNQATGTSHGGMIAIGALEAAGISPIAGPVPGSNRPETGNARGANAVDWQMNRQFATQVASGAASTIAGGKNNRASQANATVSGGTDNIASSSNSTVGGGNSNTADAVGATVPGGQNATARGTSGAFAYANGRFGSTDGSAQRRVLPFRRTVTDAAGGVLTTDGAAPGSANQVVLPNGYLFGFRGEFVIRDTGGNSAMFEIKGLIKRGANAAATAFVGTPVVTKVAADTNASAYAITVAVDTTLGGMTISATLIDGRTADAYGTIYTQEVQ